MQHQNVGTSPCMMQPAPQHQQQQQPPQQPPVEKTDSISKAKNLVLPLREKLSLTFKAAADSLQHNNFTDVGTIKSMDKNPARFDKYLEEFYSICDQIELQLKTSIQCIQQNNSSNHYMPVTVAPTRIDPIMDMNFLSYPQYLATVRSQIGYAKEIHDTLICASQNISPSE